MRMAKYSVKSQKSAKTITRELKNIFIHYATTVNSSGKNII